MALCGPGTYVPTREKKLEALCCYQKLFRHLIPTDRILSSSHLWQGDLHGGNIFVDPAEPTKIFGIADWQSTELAPLYFQARQPHIIDYGGPPMTGLQRPQRFETTGPLDSEDGRRANALYLQQSLCSLYNTWTHHHNPHLFSALQFPQTSSFDLLLLARNLLVDGEATYLARVAELEAVWCALPGFKGFDFPLSFMEEERAQMQLDVDGALRGMGAMQAIREDLGELFPNQGLVRDDQYDEAVDALAQMKDLVIAEYAKTESERGE
ncbi:hypothetical protein NX059_002887 [Plenodomus lindquistii]|nr:hypothetical protein NX059_002887 [Plenodomus lindquistii]